MLPTINNRITITESQFISNFSDEWFAAVDNNQAPSFSPYEDRESWKEFIEGQDGLLSRVLSRINPKCRYMREIIFRFDGAYCFDKDNRYPVEFAAFIEHEMNNDPEREMQKLILARAPLKVLIFYDWSEYEKRNDWRRQWVQNKLSWFETALNKVNEYCPETIDTSYIFIIGHRDNDNSEIEWYHASNSSLKPTPLQRRG